VSAYDVCGNVTINWMYPEMFGDVHGEQRDRLTIALYSVRAAPDLVVEYDSKRDGWRLLVDRSEHGTGKPVEVGFIPSWPECESCVNGIIRTLGEDNAEIIEECPDCPPKKG
jgi:hypothetical protein